MGGWQQKNTFFLQIERVLDCFPSFFLLILYVFQKMSLGKK